MISVNEIIAQEELEKESIRKHWIGYVLHNLIVKRIFSNTSIGLQDQILDLIIGQPKKILDVSCGDDDLIIRVCRKFGATTCVANDFSPKLTSFIEDKDIKVIYTNFNILSQPFSEKFDLVICKNTLHHIPRNYQFDLIKYFLIKYLLSISSQLIVVDIENPTSSSVRAKIWNWYYRKLLGDKGNYFLDFNDFQSLLSLPANTFTFGKISTVKGEYMYGVYREKISNSLSSFS